jgi:peroxiredoxin
MTLRVGDRAPDVELMSTTGERIALSSLRGWPGLVKPATSHEVLD